jgi:hypothetical protein
MSKKPKVSPEIREYFSKLGKKGGKISRRKITADQQKALQEARAKKKLPIMAES